MSKKGEIMELLKAKEEFLFHCKYEKNLSEKTIKSYKIDLNQFIKMIGKNKKIEIITKEDIKKFIKFLYIKNLKSRSIKRKIATIKALFNYLEFEDIIQTNPIRKIKINLKTEKDLPKIFTKQELKKIFQAIYNEKKNATTAYQKKIILRDLLIIELLFFTGIRVSELCNLKLKDINLQSKKILIHGKGSKEREVLINEEISNLLRQYLQNFIVEISKNNYLFVNRFKNPLNDQSVRIIINKYTKLAKVKRKITPHMFRHTLASMLLEEGIDIRIIQYILGHSSILTTQIYTHINTKHYKKILKRHPRNLYNFYAF